MPRDHERGQVGELLLVTDSGIWSVDQPDRRRPNSSSSRWSGSSIGITELVQMRLAGILTIIITHDARVLDGVDEISHAVWRVKRNEAGRMPLRSRPAPLASPQLVNNDMAPE